MVSSECTVTMTLTITSTKTKYIYELRQEIGRADRSGSVRPHRTGRTPAGPGQSGIEDTG
jgi:hypothetical protein